MDKALQRVTIMKLNVSVVLMMVASVFMLEAHAQQLYKWVDAQGVTHYGETLPSQDVEHVAFEFTQDYQVQNSQDDYYSIQNQLTRLQQQRSQQRSQQRAEKQQAAEARAPEIIYVQANEPQRRYYSPAYYPSYRPNHYNKKYHGHYSKQDHHKSYVEKPRSGIAQKANVNRSSAVFSVSR
jgi:hypothetical protein